jgi:spermidine/putrescine transport system substrate-binding protein
MEVGQKREALSNTRLRCLCWEGYTDGGLPSAFQRATGFSVSGENHLSDDTASRKVLDERGRWDIININTPFVQDVLYPAGAIRALSPRFADRLINLAAHFQSLQSGGAQFR